MAVNVLGLVTAALVAVVLWDLWIAAPARRSRLDAERCARDLADALAVLDVVEWAPRGAREPRRAAYVSAGSPLALEAWSAQASRALARYRAHTERVR